MKILLASSEVHPYSKTGGLADMVGALAKSLARRGHDVGVVTPLYRGTRERIPDLERFDWELNVELGARFIRGEVWIRRIDEHLTFFFIDHPEFFQRASLYHDGGVDYPDNAER